MRMVLALTLFAAAVTAMFLFIETIRIQFQSDRHTYGTFAYYNISEGGHMV